MDTDSLRTSAVFSSALWLCATEKSNVMFIPDSFLYYFKNIYFYVFFVSLFGCTGSVVAHRIFCLAAAHADSSLYSGSNPSPALGTQSFSHWTTTEGPKILLYDFCFIFGKFRETFCFPPSIWTFPHDVPRRIFPIYYSEMKWNLSSERKRK